MSKPVCIVWMNEARVCEQALARAGLGDRLEFHGVRVEQTIPADLAAHGEILVGWRPAPGLLTCMLRLRWIQSTTAGMDQWLADPALRKDIVLTCARGAFSPERCSKPPSIARGATKPVRLGARFSPSLGRGDPLWGLVSPPRA